MSELLQPYKGYVGSVDLDLDRGVLFGRVLDLRDIITFQGKTVTEAVQAFHDSVDDYLAFCKERGESPEKPFSGKLPFRTKPEHHRRIFQAAQLAGMSVNAWMDEVLTTTAERVLRAAPDTTPGRPASEIKIPQTWQRPSWPVAAAAESAGLYHMPRSLEGDTFAFMLNGAAAAFQGAAAAVEEEAVATAFDTAAEVFGTAAAQLGDVGTTRAAPMADDLE